MIKCMLAFRRNKISARECGVDSCKRQVHSACSMYKERFKALMCKALATVAASKPVPFIKLELFQHLPVWLMCRACRGPIPMAKTRIDTVASYDMQSYRDLKDSRQSLFPKNVAFDGFELMRLFPLKSCSFTEKALY